MDAKRLLEQLLQSGQELAQKGQQLAEKGLGIPETGQQRDRVVSDLGKGAVVGGVLALLLGTGVGRRIAGPLLKIGGIAAVGTIGYAAYKKWQANQSTETDPGKPISELSAEAASDRSLLLIRAMVAAANADGHIDENERRSIMARIQSLKLAADEQATLQQEIDRPRTPDELAAMSDSLSASSEIYLTSLLVIDEKDTDERNYLNQLAKSLALPWDLVKQLEAEAAAT
ncbi:MAG: tellurite resistance TerB family protein [Pirellulaceae bacterium]